MAKRYAPARALGNAMAGPRDSPCRTSSRGPGTLGADRAGPGRGKATATGWSVVIVRPLPAGVARARSAVAFAVWEG